ncbi:hypothetical protein RHGRI_014114 [Rhododendron griersonianum]|uniref:Uncharacterized protein n=1 Tax=Rhododendron griersonianum TaxID=479676 RepID=A0AAV6K8I9_9ERIC|nr:hypothetical protein RHGRI_014114 [Rhododendron griersonianum]
MNIYGLEPGLQDFGFSDPSIIGSLSRSFPFLSTTIGFKTTEDDDNRPPPPVVPKKKKASPPWHRPEASSRWNLASPFRHGLEPSPRWEEVK